MSAGIDRRLYHSWSRDRVSADERLAQLQTPVAPWVVELIGIVAAVGMAALVCWFLIGARA